MKRSYIAPSACTYEVLNTEILALSMQQGTIIGEGNKDDFEQLSNRGSWNAENWSEGDE